VSIKSNFPLSHLLVFGHLIAAS